MRTFTCGTCGQLVFFANDACLRCGSPLGLRPRDGEVVVLGDADVRCAEHDRLGCNWLVEDGGGQCVSCRTTRTWPPMDDPVAVEGLRRVEEAKRRLLWQLADLDLPTDRVRFDLLSGRHDASVMIGHVDGVVTVDVSEADDARRARVRDQLDEPYRTVLGHLRHEVGHALWPVLVEEVGEIEHFVDVFGDPTTDYQQALERHYDSGAPEGWEQHHVSAYATMHPHEDWAETFAHYLHVRDTLQTAESFQLEARLPATVEVGAFGEGELGRMLGRWLPLTYALNAVNRSMGQRDLYPFVIASAVVDKLDFVHHRVGRVAAS